MSHSIKLLAGEPIVVAEFGADFNLAKEQDAANQEFFDMLDGATEKLWLVIDLSKVVFSLTDIIEGASSSTRGAKPSLRHPQIQQTIIVTNDALTRMAAQGMRTATFGSVNLVVAASMDEALAMARGGKA